VTADGFKITIIMETHTHPLHGSTTAGHSGVTSTWYGWPCATPATNRTTFPANQPQSDPTGATNATMPSNRSWA
jgi:hypothetical protein